MDLALLCQGAGLLASARGGGSWPGLGEGSQGRAVPTDDPPRASVHPGGNRLEKGLSGRPRRMGHLIRGQVQVKGTRRGREKMGAWSEGWGVVREMGAWSVGRGCGHRRDSLWCSPRETQPSAPLTVDLALLSLTVSGEESGPPLRASGDGVGSPAGAWAPLQPPILRNVPTTSEVLWTVFCSCV